MMSVGDVRAAVAIELARFLRAREPMTPQDRGELRSSLLTPVYWLLDLLMTDQQEWARAGMWFDGILESRLEKTSDESVLVSGGAVVVDNRAWTLNPFEGNLALAPAASTLFFEGERGAIPYRKGGELKLRFPAARDEWAYAFDVQLPPVA